MSRVLPIAVVQAQPQKIDEPLSSFSEHAQSLLKSFPQTRMIVYPELHLFHADLNKQALLE